MHSSTFLIVDDETSDQETELQLRARQMHGLLSFNIDVARDGLKWIIFEMVVRESWLFDPIVVSMKRLNHC